MVLLFICLQTCHIDKSPIFYKSGHRLSQKSTSRQKPVMPPSVNSCQRKNKSKSCNFKIITIENNARKTALDYNLENHYTAIHFFFKRLKIFIVVTELNKSTKDVAFFQFL